LGGLDRPDRLDGSRPEAAGRRREKERKGKEKMLAHSVFFFFLNWPIRFGAKGRTRERGRITSHTLAIRSDVDTLYVKLANIKST
jgi:hypothetical protein